MDRDDLVVRAWKDAEFRSALSPSERALIPEHPSGLVELDEDEMASVEGAGGGTTSYLGMCPTSQCGGCCNTRSYCCSL